jgi:UDPglucose 6-dehydrogenase
MKIGVIGSAGVVGGACKFGFELLGHNVAVHDIALDTTIDDVLDTVAVYICVPTPRDEDGSCDVSIVEQVIHDLQERNYEGIIAIKSTVVPGTTERLRTETGLNICFVPEFLRERCAITDFTENHDVCILGCMDDMTYKILKDCHGSYPDEFVRLTPSEAEFCKYFNNVYNAMLIIFANSFYEACKIQGVNYTNVKNAVVKRKHIHGNYLECNDNFRGFGGMCLPKDVSAMAKLMQETGVDFFQDLLDENSNYRITVFEGMRK